MNDILKYEGPAFKFLDKTDYHGTANYKEFFSDIITYMFEEEYEAAEYTDTVESYSAKQAQLLPSIYLYAKQSIQFFPKLFAEYCVNYDPQQVEWYGSAEEIEETFRDIIDYNGGYPSGEMELVYLDDVLTGLDALHICYYADTYKNHLDPSKHKGEFRVTNIVNSPIKGVW